MRLGRCYGRLDRNDNSNAMYGHNQYYGQMPIRIIIITLSQYVIYNMNIIIIDILIIIFCFFIDNGILA